MGADRRGFKTSGFWFLGNWGRLPDSGWIYFPVFIRVGPWSSGVVVVVGFVVRGDAEATPGFGDDNAVSRIMEIVTDLDGQISSDVADVIGEGGNVLGALVGDAGDAVVVDGRRGVWVGSSGAKGASVMVPSVIRPIVASRSRRLRSISSGVGFLRVRR